jgi:hypothetical protein
MLTILPCLLLISVGGVFGQSDAAEKSINRALDQIDKGHISEDVDLVSSFLSDAGYVLVIGNHEDPSEAVVCNKIRVLRATVHRWAKEDLVECKHTERKIEIHGPVATSCSTIISRTKSGEIRKRQMFDIWAKERGEWKVVFSCPVLANK